MRKQMLFLSMLLAAGGGAAWSQAISAGAKLAVPQLDATAFGGRDQSPRVMGGPSIEFRLPSGFAVEADALYRRVGNTSEYTLLNTPATAVTNRLRGSSWQFPVLGKYYFRTQARGWQPFVAAGWALRTARFQSDQSQIQIDANGGGQVSVFHNEFKSDLVGGGVVGVGVRWRAGRWNFLPEFRYTRYTNGNSPLRRGEAGIFLGIGF